MALLWNRLVERDSYLLFFVYPYGVGWKNRDLVVQCSTWYGCAPADIVIDDSEKESNYSVQSGL